MMNNQFLLNMFLQNPQIKNNPIAQNAIRMYQNGDTNGLNEMANNIAREKNIDINQLTNDLKAKLGI